MAQDVHHVGVPAVSAVLASMQTKGQSVSRQNEEELGSSCLQQADVVGRVSLDLSVQRTPLLQLACVAAGLLVCWSRAHDRPQAV